MEDAIPFEDEVAITLLLFLLFRDVFLLDELAVDAEAGDFAVFAIEDRASEADVKIKNYEVLSFCQYYS